MKMVSNFSLLFADYWCQILKYRKLCKIHDGTPVIFKSHSTYINHILWKCSLHPTDKEWLVLKCLNACKTHFKNDLKCSQMVNFVQLIGGGNQRTYPCVLVALRQRSHPYTYMTKICGNLFSHLTNNQLLVFKWLNWCKMHLISTQRGSYRCQIACSIFKSGTCLSESL